MTPDEMWRSSHERWWEAQHTQLLKLNYGRGLTTEEPAMLRNIPLEMRSMLPIDPSADSSPAFAEGLALPDGLDPATAFFAKIELDRLCGESSAPPETDWDKFLRKLVGESEAVLNNRVALPTHTLQKHHTDVEPLAKSFIRSSLTALLDKLRHNAAAVGAHINVEDMQKAVAALDIECFNILALQAVDTIDAAMRSMAA